MDTALRLLRAGRKDRAPAPLVAVLDRVDSFDGGHLVCEIAERLREAGPTGRSSSQHLLCAAADSTWLPSDSPGCSAVQLGANASGWERGTEGAGQDQTPGDTQDVLAQLLVLQRSCHVVLTCLATLLHSSTAQQVLTFLQQLTWHEQVQGVVLLLQQDLLDPAFVEQVSALAFCTLSLEPVGGINVLLRTHTMRKTGAMAARTEALQRSASGRLLTAPPVVAKLGLAPLAAAAAAGAPGKLAGTLQQEQAAKASLVMPYELSIAPSAGISTGAGAIYYERDSEGEYDSDVDPDDDLDF